ncbi:Synaptobrevin [Legionella beliardensis]|uniref:Synaptobrevin n=1 Tax=Legionella beliardensis TaxID=91822 RepID=A0A378HYU0_9GAMM|nr:R-SNARE family protein [Legionella beliardensis]STX27883.1 Synaptobrevin [Legionella beliardensis]
MKCYALATCINSPKVTWSIPDSSTNSNGFFIRRFLGRIKEDISALLYHLPLDTCQGFQKEGYYLYGQRISSGFYGLACDTKLNEKQLTYLSFYLFSLHIEPDLIASDLSMHTQDQKIMHIKAELEKTKEIMKQNIEKILARGEQIEELVAHTEKLKEMSSQLSFKFHYKTKKEANDLPHFCNLI